MKTLPIEPQVVQTLTNIIEEYLNVNLHDPTRKQENVTGRMIYYKILREHKYGYQAIARTLERITLQLFTLSIPSMICILWIEK